MRKVIPSGLKLNDKQVNPPQLALQALPLVIPRWCIIAFSTDSVSILRMESRMSPNSFHYRLPRIEQGS